MNCPLSLIRLKVFLNLPCIYTPCVLFIAFLPNIIYVHSQMDLTPLAIQWALSGSLFFYCAYFISNKYQFVNIEVPDRLYRRSPIFSVYHRRVWKDKPLVFAVHDSAHTVQMWLVVLSYGIVFGPSIIRNYRSMLNSFILSICERESVFDWPDFGMLYVFERKSLYVLDYQNLIQQLFIEAVSAIAWCIHKKNRPRPNWQVHSINFVNWFYVCSCFLTCSIQFFTLNISLLWNVSVNVSCICETYTLLLSIFGCGWHTIDYS